MVSSFYSFIFQCYWERSIRQDLNRVSGFKVALASAGFARELPNRRGVVHERIVVGFCDLVADRGHIFKSAAEDSRRNPACELSDPAAFRHCAVSEISVETKNAAAAPRFRVVRIEREQESVGQQRKIECVSGESAGVNLIVHDDAKLLVKEQVEHQHKAVAISRDAGLVIDRLNDLAAEANIHEFRHGN